MAMRVSRYGFRYILQRLTLLALFGVALFAAAGSWSWPRGWVALGVFLVCDLVIVGALATCAPETLNQRGTRHAGVERYERVFALGWLVSGFAQAVVAGLDAVRYGWCPLPWSALAISVAPLVAATAFGTWAMVVNEHFEQFMRIQTDRAHRVVSTGPYRVVRHPGYAGAIVGTLGGPLLLGSAWAFLPACATVALLVWRTQREDTMLREQLDGYREYAEQTRYRLVPFVW